MDEGVEPPRASSFHVSEDRLTSGFSPGWEDMGRSPYLLPHGDPRNHDFLCEQYYRSMTSLEGHRPVESLRQGSCHFTVRHVLRGILPFFFSYLFLVQEKDQRHLDVG
jgi:hypothetical protein